MRDSHFRGAMRETHMRLHAGSSAAVNSPFARIAAVAITLALIAPSLFIVCEAHHDCSGDGCQVCHVLAIASSLAHADSDAPTGSSAPVLLPALVPLTLAPVVRACATTLVDLQVWLDC